MSDFDRRVIGVVNPVDARLDEDGDAIDEMGTCVLKCPISMGDACLCLGIDDNMKTVKLLSMSQ